MPLIKTPPGIEVHAPKPVVPGPPFRVDLWLHAKVPVPVDEITLTLRGELRHSKHAQLLAGAPSMGWALGDDNGALQITRVTLWLQRTKVLQQHVELAARSHCFSAHFQLPTDTLGTYRGPGISVVWQLTVDVSIPWWPDSSRTFDLHVLQPPSQETRPAPPTLYSTNPRGPSGNLPYAEVSLASTVVRPGGILSGQLSVANAGQVLSRALRISMRQVVAITQGVIPRHHADPVSSIAVPVPAASTHPIPFSLRVPDQVVPGFTARGVRLSWQLWVEMPAIGYWVQTIKIDIGVVSNDLPAMNPGQAPSLAIIGPERQAMVWAAAAAEAGFSYEGGMLIQREERYVLSIALESRGRGGNRLVAEIQIIEVDIGLHLEEGQLRCRDAEHSRRIAEATGAMTERHHLAHADDRRLRYEVADGGLRAQGLVVLARWAEALAHALLDARAELDGPTAVAHLRPAFERAAGMLGGRFVPAGMDVWGTRDEVPFSLESRWDADDRYCCTTLGVGTLLPIDGRYHGHYDGGDWPPQLPEGLPELLEGARGLTIVPQGIEIHFPPFEEGDPDGVGIEPLVERLEGLIAIGRRLSMRDGVYR